MGEVVRNGAAASPGSSSSSSRPRRRSGKSGSSAYNTNHPSSASALSASAEPLRVYLSGLGGRRFRVEGIPAQMILAILSHQGEIARYQKGALEMHWGEGQVVGRMHPLWDNTVAPVISHVFGMAEYAASRERAETVEAVLSAATIPMERAPWE